MRGGSSRGGFFLRADLPEDERLRSAVLLALYGSPDSRQIDGIGGADPLTSKAAIVGPPTRPDADVDYTFCQVNVDRALVSTGGNCGNMLAGVGPFAIMRGLIAPVEPITKVRIHTTNTGQVVTALVPVVDGAPAVDGDCAIAGVPGTGARIDLDFGDCAGAVSGKLLPTGKAVQMIAISGQQVRVSLVDAATPFVFVVAEDIGATGTEMPTQLLANVDLMRDLELARGWAAVTLGLAPEAGAARDVTPNVPRVMLVARPADYTALDGTCVAAREHDVLLRQLAMQKPHRALAVTGGVCAAVAAAVPGSVVVACRQASDSEDLRIGHPSGVMRVGARVAVGSDGAVRVRNARIERTARLIMAGTVYARRSAVQKLMERMQ
jgi:2-methylaconitate cis-trans-isomerase PrpF